MKIFEFDNYKRFLNEWMESQPQGGRGQLSKISKALNVHSTLLSHTIRGSKDLTVDQAFSICEYIGLNDDEADYFLLLVQIERAGSLRLKNKFIKDLKKLKMRSQDLGTRVRTDKILSEVEKAQFYSSWIYAATRQLSSVSRFQSRAKLTESFGLRAEEMNRVIDFLVTTGLCVESGNQVKIGPNKTHLESQSPFIFNHHKNWRLKGFEKHNNLSANDLMYTAPFTVSEKDFLGFREKLVQLIEQLVKMAGETKSEHLACFNADLFVLQ